MKTIHTSHLMAEVWTKIKMPKLSIFSEKKILTWRRSKLLRGTSCTIHPWRRFSRPTFADQWLLRRRVHRWSSTSSKRSFGCLPRNLAKVVSISIKRRPKRIRFCSLATEWLYIDNYCFSSFGYLES